MSTKHPMNQITKIDCGFCFTHTATIYMDALSSSERHKGQIIIIFSKNINNEDLPKHNNKLPPA